MITVRLSPLRPTTTCWETFVPSLTTFSVASDPVPVIAAFGTVTPWACWTITEADALIPGLTRESRWSSVSVASYETTLLLVVPTVEIEVTCAPSSTPVSASSVTVAD